MKTLILTFNDGFTKKFAKEKRKDS